MNQSHSTRFYRDSLSKKISGVCAGFAKRYQLPVWLTRLAVIILFLNAPIAVAAVYFICHFAFEEQVVI